MDAAADARFVLVDVVVVNPWRPGVTNRNRAPPVVSLVIQDLIIANRGTRAAQNLDRAPVFELRVRPPEYESFDDSIRIDDQVGVCCGGRILLDSQERAVRPPLSRIGLLRDMFAM